LKIAADRALPRAANRYVCTHDSIIYAIPLWARLPPLGMACPVSVHRRQSAAGGETMMMSRLWLNGLVTLS